LYACPNCKISYEELEARTFSFNSPYGACPTCEGLGSREEFDPELVLAEEDRSLEAGLVLPWKNDSAAEARKHRETLAPFLERHEIQIDTPYAQWKPAVREKFLRGDPATADGFLGLLVLLEKEFATATKSADQERLAAFRGRIVCAECGGARIRPEARSVRFAGKAFHETAALPVEKACEFFAAKKGKRFDVATDDLPIFEPLAAEIRSRLAFLDQVGLSYLTLDRPADTLSGGELQRVRLATGI